MPEHYDAALWEVKGPEPRVAETLLTSFLGDVDVRLRVTDVPDAAGYVDASYEGDLLAPGRRLALGSYNIDIREVERTWRYLPGYVATPAAFNEGYLPLAVPAYAIPYRSRTPRREDAENLLVPACLSASQVAFGSVRMEPRLMLLGHVAGLAAAQASRRGVAVQDVDVAALQHELREQGQVLAL